jgi:phytoene synthase
MIAPENVSEAYKYCRKVTLRFARTFYFASIFLPAPKRNACYAVYAFCRYLDDLVDESIVRDGGAVDRAAVDRMIARWRSDLDRVYAGEDVASPVMTAWGDTLGRFPIGRSLPDELIEGVMSDLRPSVRFETFEELHGYCYKVASVVGLMTSEIFGYGDRRALGHAIDLGVAMQLTNILRDINEDFAANRIYIPREELERFGIDERNISEKRVCESFRRMMRFQIERAHGYYESADAGIPMLERDSRLTVTLMSHNYRRILGVIERNGYDIYSRRASVPLHRKLMTVPALWYETR